MHTLPSSPIRSACAWTAQTLSEDAGRIHLDAGCVEELHRVGEMLDANPLPVEALRPSHVEMPRCAAAMARVRAELDDGVGFAVIDRLPVEALSRDGATRLYWLLMSMVGRPVAQKWDGTMVYDVTDEGRAHEPGNGVRSSKTNSGQAYHTDNSFNVPPEHVALLCLRPARSGGLSGVISFQSVYNTLLEERPEVLPRLTQPFWFDRQHEHPPDDPTVSRGALMQAAGGEVHVRFSRRLVSYGYTVAGEAMDDETRDAFDALSDVITRPELEREFDFEPGQIQVLDNRRLGHRRTAYEDWPEPGRRRHLVRIWLRNSGRPFYMG